MVKIMKKNGSAKAELINKIRSISGLDPTKKFGDFSEKELRGYALFAQILDDAGFQIPAHWDNWKWNNESKILSVNVYWSQIEWSYDNEDGLHHSMLEQRSAWVHFEDTTMSGGCVKSFFKRFKNAPHFIDWSDVYKIKAWALPEDPVDEEEEDE